MLHVRRRRRLRRLLLRVLVRLLHDGPGRAYGAAFLDGRRRRRDALLVAGHEYAIPATGTVKYDCTSATGDAAV